MSDVTAEGGLELGGEAIAYFTIAAPGGILTGPIDALRDALAASTTVQNLLGGTDVADTKNKVGICSRSASGVIPFGRPVVAVLFTQGSLNTTIRTGSYNSGTLYVLMQIDTPEAYLDNPMNAANHVLGITEGIVQDLWTTFGTGAAGRLLVRDIEFYQEPQRSDFEEEKEYWESVLSVSFGVQS